MTYKRRRSRSQSSHGTRRSHDRPGSRGKPDTGGRRTGNPQLEQREVRVMRTAETVLQVIRDRGKRGLLLEEDVYRQLYNPNLYLLAYSRIYKNDGALTQGVTKETADGMSRKKIETIIEQLRYERFRWTPVRRVEIPKKNGKKRPLGIPILRSYCPPYRVLSGLRCREGSDQPIPAGSTVPYFARADESAVVSSGAELACVALR